ncbi:hypothetical protein [Thermogemmatispora carboxidivorans]|uniref:hypothetical protein n=1 Tax=Thermogemmatispora carboxidivorans TaxID=1382306 RepID=UPI000AD7A5C3|nr:hypothetical protein [Thermogemmatispora carboxidivorans]
MLEPSFLLPGRCQIYTSQQQNLGGNWLGKPLLALLLAMGLLLAGGRVALAESVTVSDGAGVLDVARVKSEGAKLPYPLEVDTTNSFSGSQTDFEGYARGRVSAAERLIVIAIDTVHRWVYIESGNAVPLSDSEAEDAYTAFKEHYRDGSYTGATLAAIQSLEKSLTVTSATVTSEPDESSGSVNQGFDWTGVAWTGCFCISTVALFFLVIGAAANEDAARRRRGYRGGESSTGFGASSWGSSYGGGFSDSGGSIGGGFSDSGGSAGGSFSDSGGSAGGSFSDSGGSAGGSFSDSGGGAGGSF